MAVGAAPADHPGASLHTPTTTPFPVSLRQAEPMQQQAPERKMKWSASTWVERGAIVTRLWVKGRTLLIQTRPGRPSEPPLTTIDGPDRPTLELLHELCAKAAAGYTPASQFLVQHHQEIVEGVLDGRLFCEL